MKHKLLLSIIWVILITSSSLHAQERSVSGKITDVEDGAPIPGATIAIKGTTQGTVSDADGNYKISVDENATLVISFLGYATEEILVGNQTQINVTMMLDIISLSEIVVVGYGEVQKKDATGSIVSVSSEDFNKGAITSPQELLMGKVPGASVTMPSGQPGAGATIRIRGGSSIMSNNDPLIVVDGIPLDGSGMDGVANELSIINPNDIESFSVLKDASATAIFGSRASNGVIIITTKRGTAGKMKIGYNGNVSVGVPVKLHEVYNAAEYRALIQDRVDNHGLTSVALDGLGTADTDWQNEVYQNPVSTEHNVNVSGTAGVLPYRASVGYTNQNGLLKNSNFNRTTVNVAISPSLLNGDLKMDINAKGSFMGNDFSNTDAIGSSVVFDPTQPITNGNTRYGGYTAWTELSSGDPLNGGPNNIATHNPVAQLEYRDNTSKAQRYILGGKFDYNLPFLNGLKATLSLGYDLSTSSGVDQIDTLASWSAREPDRQYNEYDHSKSNSLVDFYFTYDKEFADMHDVVLTAGISNQMFTIERNSLSRKQFMEVGDETIEISRKFENLLRSYFGRLNYIFNDKYMLTATLRADGSSRYATENQWGLFPSFALGWKINNEGFLSDVDALDELKLRLGWGQTGQQNTGTSRFAHFYPYLPAWEISQQGAFYQFGNTFYPTLRPGAYDEGLQWETTTTQNIGLDFGFLSGRISGSFDYYKRVTEDLLNEVPVAAGTNFSNFLITNVGTLENTGYEISLTGAIISTEDMTWELTANLSSNRNEITKLTVFDDPAYTGIQWGGIAGGVGNNIQRLNVGQSFASFYTLGQVYDENGNPIEGLYVDRSGEGGLVAGNEANRAFTYDPAPDYLIGMSSMLKYKNIDFSFAGRISLGNYVYNNNASNMALYQNLYNQSGFTTNILKAVEETNFMTAQYFSDFYMENASFFRMDNMTLGYNFDQLLTEKLSGRVSFTVQNAFVITKYSGIDPELDGGIDNNLFPRPRTYMLGFNLNF